MPYEAPCTVCSESCALSSEARVLSLTATHELRISDRGAFCFTAQDVERATACGQRCSLILAERAIERCTFAPAEHSPSSTDAPAPAADDYAELT